MGSDPDKKLKEERHERIVELLKVWKATNHEGPRFLARLGPVTEALKRKIDQAVFSHYLTPKEGGPQTLFDARDQEVDRCIKEYINDCYENVRKILIDNEELKKYLNYKHNLNVDVVAKKYFNNPQGRKKVAPRDPKTK